jgi:hypothetical protein
MSLIFNILLRNVSTYKDIILTLATSLNLIKQLENNNKY